MTPRATVAILAVSERRRTSPAEIPTVRSPTGPTAQGQPRASLLAYFRGGAVVLPLSPQSSVVVGRGAPADLVVDDRSLSRWHARFFWEDGKLWVEDLGSTNGTRMSPPDSGPVARRPRRTRASIHVVSVTQGQPLWANVSVDGRAVGTSPVSVPHLRTGLHRLTVTRPGFRTATQKLLLRPGERRTIVVTLTEARKND